MTRRVETSDETALVSLKANAATQLKKKTTIKVIYLIAALDITWMFLQFSITPYLAKKLGFDTLWFGYLQSMVGLIQLFGGPLFGRFADVIGARAALSLACTANIVFFILLAVADSPVMLFVHKLPTVVMHVLPASQMVVADLSEPEKRADALSKLGLCFGFGMIAGSTLGGHLVTSYGERFAAYSGAAGSTLSLLLVLSFIPQTTKVQSPTAKTESDTKSKSIFSVGQITRLMKCAGVTPTFLIKIVAGLPSNTVGVSLTTVKLARGRRTAYPVRFAAASLHKRRGRQWLSWSVFWFGLCLVLFHVFLCSMFVVCSLGCCVHLVSSTLCRPISSLQPLVSCPGVPRCLVNLFVFSSLVSFSSCRFIVVVTSLPCHSRQLSTSLWYVIVRCHFPYLFHILLTGHSLFPVLDIQVFLCYFGLIICCGTSFSFALANILVFPF
ncbi:solute carrier family 22 member 18 isoform X2 [Phyllopteryx taeniolatus]|uniref:solute carrier family 22 member 18 isoform X2 n=1 Tax=Phyllopteryx taeniolatus TaxID=161469 RepID=UPI002AD1DA72|nr:solute carrier family 22 member 18 isoform X2 [Phyllopteryx taeniolatus]